VRILLTGRTGQVGWELERVLPALGEVVATDRESLDLADPDAIRRVVREVRPGLIVNAAAYTAVDRAESEPQLAQRINALAPGILAEEARRTGALLVHYSTDYVFDGEKATPYVEDDAPHPLNVYGRTKLEGERAIAASCAVHLILRASWVYAERGKNFYLTIARKARAGEPLRIVDDQAGVPTPARFLAESTAVLLRADTTGLLHFVPSGHTTWCGFARAIVDKLGCRAGVDPIRSGEYPTAARRPAYSVLDNRKAAAVLGRTLPDWRELLNSVAAV
jgi:dTDP-4-dehydrorhamnose reductase